MRYLTLIAIIVPLLYLHVELSSAQVMESTNYKIQSDSINFGGVRSTSSNYIMEDTLGEIATGNSTSTNFNLYAGYQQMQEVYLALSAISDVVMDSSIGGISGGTSNGTTVFTVTTDNTAGYEATIEASSNPALASGGDTFDDYTPSGADPDFSFSIAGSASEFGFTPEGFDIVSRFKDNGSSCNIGSADASASCWDGLSTVAQTIVSTTTPNHPNGTETTLKFRASSGATHVQPEGTYTATITITALPR